MLGWVSGTLLLAFTSEMVFSGTGSSYRYKQHTFNNGGKNFFRAGSFCPENHAMLSATSIYPCFVALKMVSGLRAHTYEERLAELGLTTLEERRH